MSLSQEILDWNSDNLSNPTNSNLEIIEFISEEEWLKERKNHIGASDASIIIGTSKWKLPDGRIKTPYLLWQEKLGLLNMSCDNAATRYGKLMEEPALCDYQEKVGIEFDRKKCVKNIQFPHLMVSLDGLSKDRKRAVEIKNCNHDDHELARQGKVPEKYIAQVQMQILVTDFPDIDYFSFHKGEGIIVNVKRDNKYIEELEKELAKFWSYVENLKEPPLTENDFIERDAVWLKVANELYDIKQKDKEITAQKKMKEEELKALSKGKSSRSGAFRYARSICAGRVDYKSIPELLNVNLEEFRSSPTYRWTIKMNK